MSKQNKTTPPPLVLKAIKAQPGVHEDPDAFSQYIFSHCAPVLEFIIDNLNQLSPVDKVKYGQQVLSQLLMFRPYVSKVSQVTADPTDEIIKLLKESQ